MLDQTMLNSWMDTIQEAAISAVSIEGGSELNRMFIFDIKFREGAPTVCAEAAISAICSLADDNRLSLILMPKAVESLEEEFGMEDFGGYGFVENPLDGHLTREPLSLHEGNLVYVTDTGIAAMGGTHSGHPHRVPVGRFAAANHELLILRDAELMSRRIVHDLQEKSKALLEIAKKSAVEVPSYLFESRKYRHYSMLREFEGTKTSFELEAAFATTICFAGMIDDRVANLALRLRELSADAAWSGVNLDKNGKAAKGTMAARTAARANLHNGFGNSNPLKKLQNLRNNLIHATNYYCFAELENEDILFSPSFELEQVSPDNDGLELLSEFTKNISILFESYLRWFLDECERQTKGLTN